MSPELSFSARMAGQGEPMVSQGFCLPSIPLSHLSTGIWEISLPLVLVYFTIFDIVEIFLLAILELHFCGCCKLLPFLVFLPLFCFPNFTYCLTNLKCVQWKVAFSSSHLGRLWMPDPSLTIFLWWYGLNPGPHMLGKYSTVDLVIAHLSLKQDITNWPCWSWTCSFPSS